MTKQQVQWVVSIGILLILAIILVIIIRYVQGVPYEPTALFLRQAERKVIGVGVGPEKVEPQPPIRSQNPIFTFQGTILKASGNRIVVEGWPVPDHPWGPADFPISEARTAIVNPQTKFVRSEFEVGNITAEESGREIQGIKTAVKSLELEIGDEVVVFANVDVQTNETFEVSRIEQIILHRK